MNKFFANIICAIIPNKKKRDSWRKKLIQQNKYDKILSEFHSLIQNNKELQQQLKLVSNHVDFANGHLVQISKYFINSLSEDRILSLPHNKKFIFFSYPQAIFHASGSKNTINLGDYVQTIATQNAIVSNYSSDIQYEYWDRDNLINYISSDGYSKICIMQGFFFFFLYCFPNKYIFPIFIGFHLGGCMEYAPQANGSENLWKYFIQHFPQYLKNKSVGCRDKRTALFLRSMGIKTYFSRCLTLTLPQRTQIPKENKVFISCFSYIGKVLDDKLPLELKSNCINISPEFDVNQVREQPFQALENVDILPYAKEYLDKLKKEATLVITDRIHVASPCIAMGIPTIVIKRSDNDPRYDIFDGITKCYTLDDLKQNKVNFSPKTIDIETLKQYMLENLKLTIEEEAYNIPHTEELANLRKKIESFSVH